MASDIEVTIGVEVDKSQVNRNLKDVASLAKVSGVKAGVNFGKGFGKSVNRTLKGAIGGAVSRLGIQIGALGATLGAAFAVRGVVKAGETIERIETQFTTLLGSAGAASKQIEELINFASATPFQLEGLADASASLLAFGFQSDTLIDRLKKIGDVASGSNSDLKEVALIYGQVAAAGKLTGERLLQFQERAIPIGAALADSLGVAESEVKGLVSAGKVGFPEFEKAFNRMSDAGGLFAGATERQSKTIGGLLSTLGDNFFALQTSIAKAFGPIFKKLTSDAIRVVQFLTKTFNENAKQIVLGALAVAKSLNSTLVPALVTTGRVANIVFGGFVTGFKSIFALSAKITALFGRLANFVGIGGSLAADLILVSEAADAALMESVAPLNEQLKGLLDPVDFQERTAEYLEVLSGTVSDMDPILNTMIKKTNAANKKVAQSFKKTGLDIGKTISQVLATHVSGGIEKLTKSLVLGQKGFGSFAQNVAALMGDLAVSLGKMFIASGIAIDATKNLGGAGAIAAGAALVAVGTILKSFSGGAGGGAAAGGGGGAAFGGGSGGGVAVAGGEDTTTTDQEEERVAPGTTVNLTVQGDVLDSDDTGTRLAQLISNAFDSDGVVIRGAV